MYFGTNWTHQKSVKLPQKTDLHTKLWEKVHGFTLFHEGSQGPPTAGRYPHEKVWTHDTFSHSFVWRYEQTGTYRFFVEFSSEPHWKPYFGISYLHGFGQFGTSFLQSSRQLTNSFLPVGALMKEVYFCTIVIYV